MFRSVPDPRRVSLRPLWPNSGAQRADNLAIEHDEGCGFGYSSRKLCNTNGAEDIHRGRGPRGRLHGAERDDAAAAHRHAGLAAGAGPGLHDAATADGQLRGALVRGRDPAGA